MCIGEALIWPKFVWPKAPKLWEQIVICEVEFTFQSWIFKHIGPTCAVNSRGANPWVVHKGAHHRVQDFLLFRPAAPIKLENASPIIGKFFNQLLFKLPFWSECCNIFVIDNAIVIEWCWLMIINALWFWLMLLDSDCCWLMVIDSD